MLTTLALAVAVVGQVKTMNVPRIVYDIPVVGGQREIVLGPRPVEFTQLNGYYERDIAARHLATGDNTAGYVDSVVPSGTEEYNLGYFDSSVKSDTLFDKPCSLVTSNAKWIQKMGRKPNQVSVNSYAKQQWWISADGKILRQYFTLKTPAGTQTGDCVYGKDSIQRRYTDIRGETSFAEMFPSCGMDALNAQFTPMVQDGKVLTRDKEFFVLNPLTGGLEKFSAHISGTFKGDWLYATFKGKTFDIEGPNHFFQKVFLDDTGDLVKVQLDDQKTFVIAILPSTHTDQYGHPIHKSGG